MDNPALLSAKKICKAFGPTRALVDVDIDISRGEIRGLIGENGSGKSTFASIAAGAQFPDSGSFLFNGKPYAPKNMVDAQDHGISMVVQEMGTISGITVASNIFLGRLPEFSRFGTVNFSKMNKQANQILKELGINDIKADMPVLALNFEYRKIVEIARSIVLNPELLIIDETTTALAHTGRKILYQLIERLHKNNRSVLFISHDLDELMETCDSITVLRDGHVVDTLQRSQFSVNVLRRLMVGRDLEGSYFRPDCDGSYDEDVVLEAKQITTKTMLNFNMELHKGEILGIGGLADCGMHELGRVLFGIDKPITGTVTLRRTGQLVAHPVAAVSNRMAYVPKERDREAIILNASIQDNIAIPSLRDLGKAFGFISKKTEKKLARSQIDLMSIRCRNEAQHCSELSGGNKQKVVFSKWLAKESDILILVCPTRGIDVGVKAAMYRLMLDLKKRKKSIVMISEELPELIGMSDRILIIKNGLLQGEFRRCAELSEKQIIQYMI